MVNFNNFVNLLATDSARPDWVVKSFPTIKIVLAALIAICAIFIIISVLFTKSEDDGGVNAITGHADTFYNRNKGSSLQGKMKKWTIAVAIVILVLCVAFVIVNSVYAGTV